MIQFGRFGESKRRERAVQDLASVLAETARILRRSHESDWAALTPSQVVVILEREIGSLRNAGALVNANELASLFAPTAEIQEISMASDWSDYYFELSTRFDDAFERMQQLSPE